MTDCSSSSSSSGTHSTHSSGDTEEKDSVEGRRPVSSLTASDASGSAMSEESSVLSAINLDVWAKQLGIGKPQTRKLFGGALSMDIPGNYVDLSRFREVPDNQEVWNDPERDRTVVVELLELQSHSLVSAESESVIQFHFNELCRVNESVKSEIIQQGSMKKDSLDGSVWKDCEMGSFIYGSMKVAKGRDKKTERYLNDVFVACVLIRSQRFQTDLLISYNSPLKISDRSQVRSAKGTECTQPYKLLLFFKLMIKSLRLISFSSLFTDID